MTEVIHIPEEGGECVPSSECKHHTVGYDTLNPIQTQVLGLWDRDVNVVVASMTSSGKTISAEILMAAGLREGGKAIFLSPLKAVSTEKYEDWTNVDHCWSELGVEILTGDYTLTPGRQKKINEASVVVMTSEMLDHRCRNIHSEKSDYLKEVKCLVGSTLVDTLEFGPVSIAQIVNRRLRVHVLSYNHKEGIEEYRKVTGWHQNPLGEREIVTHLGVACTEDHMVYVKGIGYKPAKSVTKESVLTSHELRAEEARKGEQNRPNGVGEVFNYRNSAGRRLYRLRELESEVLGAFADLSFMEAKGLGRLEAQKAPETSQEPAEKGRERGVWGLFVSFRDEVLRRVGRDKAPVLDQRKKGGYQGGSGNVNRPDRSSRVVHGRWFQTKGSILSNAHPVFLSGVCRGVVCLVERILGSKIPDCYYEERSADFGNPGGIRRALFGPSEGSSGLDPGYGAQDPERARVSVLQLLWKAICDRKKDDSGGGQFVDLRKLHMQGSPVSGSLKNGVGQKKGFVYDITVEGNHNFFADGVLVHNCLVVDEAHLMTMEGRGAALESGIVRFTEVNPGARIVLLSATMPNVTELGDWLTTLNGKDTHVIQSEWRPTKLDVHWVDYHDKGSYWDVEENKIEQAIKLVKAFKQDKWIIFVHSKNSGKKLIEALKRSGERPEFHNSNVSKPNRSKVEGSFKTGTLRILVATSTLAWGINLPARRVLVLGLHRGLEPVDPIDVKQMVGRAGRLGLDPKGDAHVLVPRSSREMSISKYSKVGNIVSNIQDPKTLAFCLVAEVNLGSVKTVRDAKNWYSRTLAYQQKINPGQELKDILSDLVEKEILAYEDKRFSVTKVGEVSARLYLPPFDVADWVYNLGKAVRTDQLYDDVAMSLALGNVDSSYDEGSSYLPKPLESQFYRFMDKCRSKKVSKNTEVSTTSLLYYFLLDGRSDYSVAARMWDLKQNFGRVVLALRMLNEECFSGGLKTSYLSLLETRISSGCSWKEAELCQIKGLGPKKAKKLVDNGIKSVSDIIEFKESVIALLGKTTGRKVVDAAEWEQL